MEDYKNALRMGQKEYKARVTRGQYPYLQVLDELLRFAEPQGETSLGLVNIPIDHIVGTKTEGRKNAFAANFMPLLEESSEFAVKWGALSDAHLEEGIRDPIVAYEYLNRFYVQEGNKRVSVLKFFGAVSIPGTVKRIMPKRTDTVENRVYFDFLDFYRLTGVNSVWFSQPGRFKRLALAVKGDDVTPWTEEERAGFLSAYTRFRKLFKAMGGNKLPGTTGDAFLAYVKLHGYAALSRRDDDQIREDLTKGWRELAAYSIPEPVELELAPEEGGASLLSKILAPMPDILHALFLYEKSPETSAWTHAHEEGRLGAEKALEGKVVTQYYDNVSGEKAAEAIFRGVTGGNDVVFTTSPRLLEASLKAAVEYPEVKFLNCSVYCPHPSIRTYYGRMYEVKFLAGVIAGAMTRTHKIGYIAEYPIYGTPAAINAFALGVGMTDPWAKVYLDWRAQGGDGLWEGFIAQGVDMISGQDLRSPVDPWRAYGLYHVVDGVGRHVAIGEWNWSRFYERLLRLILDGKWRSVDREHPKAVNYWWGLSTGVVDMSYTDDIPADTRRLARLLEDDLTAGRLRPFDLTPEQIVKMDYLVPNVVGTIPRAEELTEEAQELCRIQGLWQEDAP